MSVTITNPVARINTTTGAATHAFGSFTPTANTTLVVLAFVSGTTAAGSMSGGGLTWTRAGSVQFNATDRAFAFYALVGASPGPSTFTIDVSADPSDGCLASCFMAVGADSFAPIRQIVTGEGSTANPSLTLPLAPRSTNGMIAGFGINRTAPAATAPAGWTESDDNGYGTPASGMACARRDSGETSATVTFTTAIGNWGMIAVEIQAGGIAGQGGGAIEATGSTGTVHIALLEGNTTAGSAGGAVHLSGGSLLVTKATFDANSAPAGGHVYAATGTLTLQDDILINAPEGSGVYQEAGATVTLTTNALFGNLPQHVAGGGLGTSVETEPEFCPVASPAGVDPSEFSAYRLSGATLAATMGTRATDYGADNPLLVTVAGCSAVACGRWQDIIRPTVPAEDCDTPGCAYLSYAGDYDADWAELLERPTGVDHRTIVCLDPEGLNLQLTGMIASMRPLTTARDVKFQEYQGQDCDLEFIDPTGTLDPAVPDSLLAGVDWRGLKVFVGSWLVGTARVLRHAVFYLDDVRAAEGVVRYRCKDAFSRLQDMQLRANNSAEQSDNAPTGDLIAPTVNVDAAGLETWTITFLTPTTYRLTGSVTGDDGEGDTGSLFTSESGAILIGSSAWTGTFTAGDTVTFKSVAEVGDQNIFEAGRDLLIQNTDLTADDFDNDTWNEAIAAHPLHIGRFLFRTPIDALSALRIIARHGPVTAFPDDEGKIALSFFFPRLGTTVENTICDTYDLASLDTERLNIHTSVTVRYAPNDSGTLTLGKRWPRTELEGTADPGNFPLTIELIGYQENDESIIDAIAQRYYALFNVQRELFNVDLLLQDLNRQLDDVVYLRSTLPRRSVYGQFVQLERDLINAQIRGQLLDVGWIVQAPGSCGYCFCDVGHLCDVCWICWA